MSEQKANDPMDNQNLYSLRFSDHDVQRRATLWKVICDSYLRQFIPRDSTVLDFGAGDCLFINAVTARRKIAVDINPDIRTAAADDVEVRVGEMTPGTFRRECDVIMASNVFEHLDNQNHLMIALRSCHMALREGGRLIILQPNFRYAFREYYDYIDHRLPLSHRGMIEALHAAGFVPEKVVPRFLPYSAKQQRLAKGWLLRLYLAVRPLWSVFGKQMLIVASRKPLSIAGESQDS